MKRLETAMLGALLALACDGALPTTQPNVDSSTDAAAGGSDAGVAGSAGTAGSAGVAGGLGFDAGCPALTFLSPIDGAMLANGCSPTFSTDVRLASNAPDGTSAVLLVGGVPSSSALVQNALLDFEAVELEAGFHQLTAELAVAGCTSSIEVQVECHPATTCQITAPVLNDQHPLLNGEPVPGGDRVGSEGDPYRTVFEVTTSIEDGEFVTLQVDGVPNSEVAPVVSGTALFSSVDLGFDGSHELVAQCHESDGAVTNSAPFLVAVDSVPPDLELGSPLDGEHFGPDNDANPATIGLTEIDVCMMTESADALDLPGSLGGRQQNFCVAINAQPATCVSAVSSAGDNACVRIECPGSTPFTLNTSLQDRAGNVQDAEITSITCASEKPSVEIVTPLTGTQADVATHLLAATAAQALKDQNPSLVGAQWTVLACSNALAGSAVLLGGSAGTTLSAIAGPVTLEPALVADGCPPERPSVARFTEVTIPESEELLNGALDSMTELRALVTDAALEEGQSAAVTLWVDSFVPSLSIFSATRCGDLVRSGNASEPVTFQFASAYDVDATLLPATTGAQDKTFTFQGAGLTEADTFDLEPGDNTLSASNIEPSGNVGALQSPCQFTLGDPPIVTWTAPANDAVFNVSTDGNAGSPGWQGDLSVTVSNIDLNAEATPVSVEFFRNGVSLGVPVLADAVTGLATLPAVTIPDGNAVLLEAVTSSTSKGVGQATLRQGSSTELLVDTIAPGPPTSVDFSLLNRRQTSFRFEWTAPADGGAQVGGYQVRVHTAPINAGNFDDVAVTKVTFAGNTGAPGTQNVGVNITNRLIERDYYAAVVAIDAAGNRSSVVADGPAAGHFNVAILSAQIAGEGLGMALDGSLSLNSDQRSDLVVGTQYGNRIYVWFAPAAGDISYPNQPGLTITGPTGIGFGNYAVAAGDLNDDGRQDLAVGSPFDNPWGSGLVYVFLQPAGGWPSALNAAAANATVSGDPSDSDFDFAFTGGSLGRAGDFDGDGISDIAIGLPYWGPDAFTGYVAVLRGSSDLGGPVILPGAVGISGSHRVTAILGESGVQGGFSSPVVGMGSFYPDSGNTLLVSGWQGSSNRVYAIAGQIGDASGEIQASDANHIVSNNQGEFGRTLTLLGTFSGSAAVGIGLPKFSGVGSAQGRTQLYFGNSVNGPFVNPVTIDNSNTVAGDLFGTVIIGSAIAGSSLQGSILGGSAADIVLAGSLEQGDAPTLYFLEGQTAQSLLGQTVDITSVASAALDLSSIVALDGWVGTATGGTPIFDLNGDGFMDLAIGEYDPSFNSSSPFDGRVVVIW